MKSVTKFSLIFVCILISRFLLIHADMETVEDFRELTAVTRKRCLAETKVALKTVEDTEDGEFPDDDRLKCYFKCCLEKFGLMNKKTGEIKYNIFKQAVPTVYRTIVSAMVDACTKTGGSNNCEKAFNFAKCMYNENPTVYLAP